MEGRERGKKREEGEIEGTEGGREMKGREG